MKPLMAILLLCRGLCLAEPLPRGLPEAQGVSSAAILGFVEAADATIDSMHSFMLVRHGQVISEGWWLPYEASRRHELYSLSKSFTSTAVGLAVAEGRLSIDDPVLKYFPEDAPDQPSDNLKALRVRDLLAMSTGQHAEDLAKFSFDSKKILTKEFLGLPVAHKPGTHFLYNTPATYMLSAIVQKVSGQTVLDYLQPRLFRPLGIEGSTWAASAQGISLGGYGLSVRTEDIARFGQLYLQTGQWHGQQLLPEAWIDAATSRQTSNGSNPESDWEQGYGYQFWRCRHGAFRGDGAFGQFCVVLPEQDAVIAITSGVTNMPAVLSLVWEKLLPAMEPERLPANQQQLQKLRTRLSTLAVRPQAGSADSDLGKGFSGKKFVFESNSQKVEAIFLQVGSTLEPAQLHLRVDGKDQQIACGFRTWQNGRLTYRTFSEQPASASGAWTSPDTFSAKVCLVETPYSVTFRLRFTESQLYFDAKYNVNFGSTNQPQLIGRLE